MEVLSIFITLFARVKGVKTLFWRVSKLLTPFFVEEVKLSRCPMMNMDLKFERGDMR